jgi:site-specific recombinase XerD
MPNPKHRGIFEQPRGSGVWHICYYDASGKRHREKVGPKRAAMGVYQLRKTEIRLGKYYPPLQQTRIRFDELVAETLASKRPRVAPRTYLGDRLRCDRLLEGWRELPAASLTPARIDERLRALFNNGLTGSTVNRYRSVLSTIFAIAVRSGRLAANPVRQVHRYKENESRVRHLGHDEEAELRKVIRATCPNREPEVDLALHTGIRRGEQFSLKWESVDLKSLTITVRGKTGRRFVPVNTKARLALESLWLISNGSAFVIPEARRDGQIDWRRWFDEAIEAAKIENFTWHDLRHTFASRLVMAGVDLSTVQKLLGHKSILMTQRYAHLAPGHLQDAVEKLAQAAPAQQLTLRIAGS